MEKDFKEKNSLESRIKIYKNIIGKYPDRVGIIVESKDVELTKNKFIVNKDQTFGHFFMTLKKFVKIKQDEALFCFINNNLPNQNELIGVLHNNYKEEDGFMYCIISKESTFGYSD